METSNATIGGADQATAQAFASSWNNLPGGSVYTEAQVRDWFDPIQPADVKGRSILELGCGNGSLFVHVLNWGPSYAEGVDLGDSVVSARANAGLSQNTNWQIRQGDLVQYRSAGFDIVYSIGVLHHLKNPRAGFQSVLENVKPGGRFHCWVYGKEGNWPVRLLVEPLRRVVSRLPWWVTKYLVATPLAVPFFFYGLLFRFTPGAKFHQWLPLGLYMRWISQREFAFFRHVAFDQLVTPQTTFLDRATLEGWLRSDPRIREGYLLARNGNSWKFGGRITP